MHNSYNNGEFLCHVIHMHGNRCGVNVRYMLEKINHIYMNIKEFLRQITSAQVQTTEGTNKTEEPMRRLTRLLALADRSQIKGR